MRSGKGWASSATRRGRTLSLGVGDELPPASGDESAGDMLQGAIDRIASGRQLPAVRDEQLTVGRVEARIVLRDDLHGGYRPDPAPFTSCRRGPYQPAHPLEHPQMPQGRVASQVTAFADQPISVTSGSKDSNRECSPRARADGSLGTTSRAYLTEHDTHRPDLSVLRGLSARPGSPRSARGPVLRSRGSSARRCGPRRGLPL